MVFLNQNPFIRTVIPFAAGIILSDFFPWFSFYIIICLLILTGTAIFVLGSSKIQTYSGRWISGVLFTLFFLTFGIYYAGQRNANGILSDTEITGKSVVLSCRITDNVEVKQNSVKTIILPEYIVDDSTNFKVYGKILCYFEKDSITSNLKYGDRLIISTFLQLPQAEMNPYSFNYRKYLAQNGIGLTVWVGSENVKLLERDKGNPLIAFSLKLRNRILDILIEQLGDSDEYKVAAAIVTGYRASLDADLRATFSNSGAMHVMCVSGLHVGIIFLVLSFVFSFLSDKILWQRIVKVIIILTVIWFYALLTGFSASVMRASAMFSFVAAGMLAQRKVPVYNSLAASAMLLLLINPAFLFQPGFQLSYFAVIGIVALFTPIQRLIPAKGKILKWIRDLIAVSVAAQIATSPISMYYFNQFPNYFILTNIIVVPLAGLIIYTAIPALIFHHIPYAGDFFGWLLGLLMKFMNGSVRFIETLPESVSQHIFISFVQVLLLYAAVITAYHAFLNRKKALILTSSLCIVTFAGTGSIHKIMQMKHSEMIYPHGLGDAIVVADHGKCLVISSDTTNAFRTKFSRSFGKYITRYNLESPEFIHRDNVLKSGPFIFNYPVIQFKSTRMIIYDDKWQTEDGIQNIHPDYILFEKSPFVEFDRLKEEFGNSVFVFTTDNRKNTVNTWEKISEGKSIPHYNMFRSGAFILNSSNTKGHY